MFRGRPHARMNRFLRIAAADPARRRVARCAVWIIPTRRPRSRREAAVRDLVVTPTAKVPAGRGGPYACRPALYAVIGNFVAKAWNGSGLFLDPCDQTAIQELINPQFSSCSTFSCFGIQYKSLLTRIACTSN